MILRRGYGKPADWWSFGALTYEMLVGKPPFQDQNANELDRKIINDKVKVPGFLTANTHAVIRGLLCREVPKRLGCTKTTMFQIGKYYQ